MEVIARFHDAVTAQQLVSYLEAHDIPASTEGGLLESFGPIVGAFKGQYAVGILQKEDLLKAKYLAEQFQSLQPVLDQAWEQDVEPDLTLLDPALLPTCPSCGLELMTVPADSRCPSCAAQLDLVALVIEQHGPEALSECYPPEEISDTGVEPIDNDAIRMMDIPCIRCRYSLRGLARQGECPECGQPYDKTPGLD